MDPDTTGRPGTTVFPSSVWPALAVPGVLTSMFIALPKCPSSRITRGMLRNLLLILTMCLGTPALASTPIVITLPSGVEVLSKHYPSEQGPILAWFSGQQGVSLAEEKAAGDLAAKGADVWLTDWLAPYFLPQLPGSVAQIPDADLATWLEAIRKRQPDRPLVLVASGHMADLALRAGKRIQDQSGDTPTGSILFFPLLYRDLEAGSEPDYVPVVHQTRMPLALLVPSQSAGFWWQDRLKAHLEEASSQVHMSVLKGLRDGFFRRGDATPQEQEAGARLGDMVWDAMQAFLKEIRP